MTKLPCKSERYSSMLTTKSHFDLSALPSDVVARIAASFKRRDIKAASSVCRAWRDELKPLLEARIYIKRGQRLKKVKSYKESLKAFFDGAALGSTRALVNAGVLYFHTGKIKEGILCYERAAELGDLRAMHYLATYSYFTTRKETFKWVYPASLAGHVPSYSLLGHCFEEGIGVKKNIQQARYWYEQTRPFSTSMNREERS